MSRRRSASVCMRRPHEAAFGDLKRAGALIPSRHEGSSSPLCTQDPPVVRSPSSPDYFKSGCEQQPSPKARETRPPRGRVFRFLRRDFEGWARAGGRRVSRSLNRRVARTPPLADGMGRKSLRVSPQEGAGLRLGRARWSGHYPRGRERWGEAEPMSRMVYQTR